jgi:hypothetical protein
MANALMLVSPKFNQEVCIEKSWFDKRDEIIKDAKSLGSKIESPEAFQKAERVLKDITKTSNQAEKVRKDLSLPYTNFAKKIKAMGDEAKELLEKEKPVVKKLIGDYLTEQERLRQIEIKKQMQAEEEARLKAEAERIEAEKQASMNVFGAVEIKPEPDVFQGDEAPVQIITAPVVSKTCSSTRMVWKYEIINPELIPRNFCNPDPVKIRKYLSFEQDSANIPGVRFYQEMQVQSR